MSKMPLYMLAATAATASAMTTYCPSASDLTVAYNGGGSINLENQGWSINGGGGVATKAAFNLLGGSVEFDIDFSATKVGVNANIYTISPSGLGSSGFNQKEYCDGAQPAGSNWCTEVDWIESNGNCGGATTLHTVAGPGSTGCTAWGCRNEYYYNGKNSFHMKIEYGTDGQWTTIRDGQIIAPSNLSPSPLSGDWNTLVGAYKNQGAVIYSSQWTGWVPASNCGTNAGDLAGSQYSVKNLVITGSVVQGPTPKVCTSGTVSSNPTSSTSSSSSGCAALYGQCGGQGFTGATCCVSGTSCQMQSQYYSQCLAATM
jgi:hypothetical protein